jgi:hypothetical protein
MAKRVLTDAKDAAELGLDIGKTAEDAYYIHTLRLAFDLVSETAALPNIRALNLSALRRDQVVVL